MGWSQKKMILLISEEEEGLHIYWEKEEEECNMGASET